MLLVLHNVTHYYPQLNLSQSSFVFRTYLLEIKFTSVASGGRSVGGELYHVEKEYKTMIEERGDMF